MNQLEKNLLGVVLCGGNSRRMGKDKGSLKTGNFTWAENTFFKLSKSGIPAVISINEKQLEDYKKIFSNSQLITDNTELEIGGPLKGILSIHKKFPRHDLLVVACDMPLLKEEVLDQLFQRYNDYTSRFDAYVFKNESRFEPLCAIYTSGALRKILHKHYNNALKNDSMQNVLNILNTCALSPEKDLEVSFINYNTPVQLEEMTSIKRSA